MTAPLPVHVYLSRHLGDGVMALPALRLLAESLAPRPLRVVVRGVVAELIAGQGTWTVVAHGGRGPAVLLAPSLRVALQAARSGGRPRVGFATDSRRLLLAHAVPGPPEPLPLKTGGRRLPRLLVREHQQDAYLRVARAALEVLGVSAAAGGGSAVRVVASSVADAAFVEAGSPSVVLHPWAVGGAAKRWPLERWVGLARALPRCVVTGGPGVEDAAFASQIGEGASVPVLAGDRALSISDWVAFASQAGSVVAPDTGIGHLARAAGVDLVSLFGATDPARHAPRGAGALALLDGGGGLPCHPCYRSTCPEGTHACMRAIGVDDVLARVAP